ncbi:MAG: hypothetical protein AUJ49_11980 [Desulfovibrionaceae bacterium CG1_02_65_16]|nr:MAG: hypothetical protein AUJ49_11980 [Desulfovibrionaceae bacterium CG1_02_65_16]
MTHNPSGLFKTSIKCVFEAFRSNPLFRNGIIAATLLSAAASLLAAFAGETVRPAADMAASVLLFALLIPLEFLIYDLVLMDRPARNTWGRMVLDARFFAYSWRLLLLALVFALPQVILSVLAGLILSASANPGGPAALLIIVAELLLISALLPPLLRVMFFPVLLAAGRPKPIKTSFRETRGKLWRILRAMFVPMTLLTGIEYLLFLLPAQCTQWGAAASVAATIPCLAGIALINSVETALFTIVYRRIVKPATSCSAYAPAGAAAGTNAG